MATTEQVKRIEVEQNRGGEWVRFGDEEYRVPPLGFAAIREMESDIAALQGIRGLPSAEQINVVVRLFHAALRRNYPSMTFETVVDMIDLGNYERVLNAVMNISGFRRAAPGEALAQSSPSTGAGSTSS